MNTDENAEVHYDPDQEHSAAGGVEFARAEAERELGRRSGVHGVGITKTPAGEDAIVVYVEDRAARAALPTAIENFPVIGEITGDIRPL